MRGSETTLGWVFPGHVSRPVRPDLLQNSSSVRTHRCTSLSLSLSRLPPLILSQLRGAGGFSLSVSLSLSLSLCLSVSLSLPLSRLSLSLSLAPTLTCNNATSMWELWVVLRAAALNTLRCERHISPSHHDALEGSCEAGGVAWVSSRPRQVNLEWVARRHPLRDRLMKVSQPRGLERIV